MRLLKAHLIKSDDCQFLWVTEFPLLEWSEEENRFTAKHHPFTSPMDEDLDILENKSRKELGAKADDMVLKRLRAWRRKWTYL